MDSAADQSSRNSLVQGQRTPEEAETVDKPKESTRVESSEQSNTLHLADMTLSETSHNSKLPTVSKKVKQSPSLTQNARAAKRIQLDSLSPTPVFTGGDDGESSQRKANTSRNEVFSREFTLMTAVSPENLNSKSKSPDFPSGLP